MTLAELNPLSAPVAISEIVIALLIAALIGYFIGLWITKSQLTRLREVLHTKEGELSDCQAQKQSPSTTYRRNIAVPLSATAMVRDDLKKIEGIGPGIERVLNAADIFSFSQLAASSPETLVLILRGAGPRFGIHNPATWPEQAALASNGKWAELDALQEKLTAGRDEGE